MDFSVMKKFKGPFLGARLPPDRRPGWAPDWRPVVGNIVRSGGAVSSFSSSPFWNPSHLKKRPNGRLSMGENPGHCLDLV